MAYVDIVTALALLQFMVFGFKVAKARGRYGVAARSSPETRLLSGIFGSSKIPWSS